MTAQRPAVGWFLRVLFWWFKNRDEQPRPKEIHKYAHHIGLTEMAIFETLAHYEPLSVRELARAIPEVTTIGFHVGRMSERGALVRYRMRRKEPDGSIGRPSYGYVRSKAVREAMRNGETVSA